jgi:DNA-binding IclR family transcriptional regulator
VRLRDSAATTGVTERTAYGIVTDLTQAGYVALTGERHRRHLVTPGTVSGAVAADAARSARSATGDGQAACEVSSSPGQARSTINDSESRS